MGSSALYPTAGESYKVFRILAGFSHATDAVYGRHTLSSFYDDPFSYRLRSSAIAAIAVSTAMLGVEPDFNLLCRSESVE